LEGKAMTTDTLTGIKIGGTIYQEGVTYTDTSALSGLLGGQVDVDNFEAEFDVSKKKLAILISSDVAGMGASASVDLKLVFAGKAERKGTLAKDFKVKKLGAGAYAGGLADTEVIANAKTTEAIGLTKAFKALGKNPEKLLRRVNLGSLDVYAGGSFAPQIGTLLGDQGISLTDRTTAVGPFGADFMASWWTAGL
jgi:hypothetical protein